MNNENNFICASNSNSCWINLFVNNVSYYWLLDTGATISALKYKYAREQNLPIHNEKIIINGIGGKVQAIGYAYLQLQSHNHFFNHKFYLFETLPCKAHGIIGQDFLNKHNAVIDFKNNSLDLWTSTSTKYTLPFARENGNIYEISARCEQIHYIRTDLSEQCVICSKELEEGVFLANSLATPCNGLIPVRILNTTDNTVTLKNIEPTIHKLSDYSICSFNATDKNADRVKRLFSHLNLKHLNEEEQTSIENLCAKYADIFYLPGDKLSTTNIYKHTITLKSNANPVFTKPYRLPYSQQKEINEQINKLLDDNIIEKCNSCWSSPLLLVPKKMDSSGQKKFRLVIEYRKLNNLIEDYKYPLPNMTDIRCIIRKYLFHTPRFI